MKNRIAIPLAVLTLYGLYLSSRYNYLLFHSLAELFSIVIACGIFMTAWNARRYINNGYLMFIGIAYLFIGSLDLLHTLAFNGMSIFPGYGANLATQLWIGARYLESLSLLFAPLLIRRQIRVGFVFLGFSGVTLLFLLSIFAFDVFPACYIDGTGLTPFKKISEYVISMILLASMGLLLKHRGEFERSVLVLLIWSIFLTIGSELAFTFYVQVYGLSNLIGHYFKILSFYLIYKALIETGLARPYELLFREVKSSEERYHSLFTHMMNGFARHEIVLDKAGRPADYVFLEVNDAFERLTGLKKEDIIGRRVTEVIPGIKTDPFDWIGVYGRIAMTGAPLRFENYAEPLNRWYSVLAYSPQKGHFATVFEDITERRRAEDALRKAHDELEVRVQERTAELGLINEALKHYAAKLEQLNRELSEFAFAASHDLREPLRKIQTFGSILTDRFKDALGVEGRDYLTRMTNAANRMSELIQSLLNYSRLNRPPESFEPTDLSKVISDTVTDLELLIREAGGTVAFGELPVIEADAVQLRQLFQNLISNALKYAEPSRPPIVKIRARTNGEMCEIMVEDNGMGFEEKHVDRVFKPFQRLHGRSEYEGTGMGLAICRKIVDRHGGSITTRPVPGEGATFIINLPIRQEERRDKDPLRLTSRPRPPDPTM
jgi:signal transduction histidine kinase